VVRKDRRGLARLAHLSCLAGPQALAARQFLADRRGLAGPGDLARRLALAGRRHLGDRQGRQDLGALHPSKPDDYVKSFAIKRS
jgi:hypothetical protein